ncbi:MAG: DUF11 domain-containing protein [Candidatus Eremiobacteraeota bacterium]|nr:DUF11 domain-containing protein [Candidatus Eremiobacteraeota bacterium]
MSANTLTGIFAPGSPALLESLRTLVVVPPRIAEPGATVRAEFSFSNLGGAAATGVRVRFALPAGVTHVPHSDTVDDVALPGESESFVSQNGAPIGDVQPNESRRLSVSYRVNEAIEDGTTLPFQAAVTSDQLPIAASNIEELIVRSKPQLQGPGTFVSLSAPDRPKPGDLVTVRAAIVNSGASSAHDVMAILPVPEHATYVARSARVAGRPIPDHAGDPFDYVTGTIVAPRLAPRQSVVVEYQATIDAPLDDGTRMKVSGAVSSREVPEFALQSAEIVVVSPVDFSGEESAFTVFCDDAVTPGTRITMVVRAANVGSGTAAQVSVAFDLPDGLVFTPGSVVIDGQPVNDEAFTNHTFSIGAIASGRIMEVGVSAVVGVPPQSDLPLNVVARLRWKGGERQFSRRLTVRATPRFARARNFVEVEKRVAQAEEDVDFVIHLLNDGTAVDFGSRLRVLPGAYLTDLRIVDAGGEMAAYESPIDLGRVDPHVERLIRVRARVTPPVADRTTVGLGAILEQGESGIDLGVSSLVVRSRPHVGECSWELLSAERLRPNRTVDILLRIANDGSDVLREAHAFIELPSELVLERAQDARRDRSTLHFGDISAKTVHEARITLRLTRARSGEGTLSVAATLYGRAVTPVPFPMLDLPTEAHASFEESSLLRSVPGENVDAGERIVYELQLRNAGDGPASQLTVRGVPSNLTVYVPGTTTVNGLPVNDEVGASALWSQRGLVLTDIDPAVDVRVRWEMAVVTPLSAGTPIEARAVLTWDEDRSHAVVSPTLTVVSTPSLAATTFGNGISIAQTIAQARPEPEPQAAWETTAAPEEAPPPPPEAAPFPPALVEIFERAHAAMAPPDSAEEAPAGEPVAQTEVVPAFESAPVVAESSVAEAPFGYIDFAPDRLARMLRMLEQLRVSGMLVHLFAIRRFFPETIVGADPDLDAAFKSENRAMQATLDRLFVRLRIPRYTLTAKDLEDRDMRVGLRQLVTRLLGAPFALPMEPAAGMLRLGGPIDLDHLRALSPELDSAPLGSAAPWSVAAAMLGTTIAFDGKQSSVLERYRSELIEAFSTLRTLPMEEFHRVLRDSANRALDDSLANVIETLRTAAHIAAD